MGGAPSGSAESSGMGDAFFFDIGQDIRITGAYSSKIGTSIMYLISTNFHKKGDKIKIHAWGSKQTTTDLFTDNLSVYE
jgi:hypothetical protein